MGPVLSRRPTESVRPGHCPGTHDSSGAPQWCPGEQRTIPGGGGPLAALSAGLLYLNTMKHEPYTTNYGTRIPGRVIGEVGADILAGVDYQKTITDHLRDLIPAHDEDLEEANEVYNYVESLIEDGVFGVLEDFIG